MEDKLHKELDSQEKYLEQLKAEMYGAIGKIQLLKSLLVKQEAEKVQDEGK